jgi:hypothetical protein
MEICGGDLDEFLIVWHGKIDLYLLKLKSFIDNGRRNDTRQGSSGSRGVQSGNRKDFTGKRNS